MSFNIALSGLNSASTQLDVISNNISNSSTTGFKSSRAEFSDVFSASTINKSGQGTQISNVRQSHTAGNLSDTGKVLDLAVDGNGFFRMSGNGAVTYTRNGAFALDREGHIVNSDGLKLTGYARAGDGSISSAMSELFIDPANQKPNPTSVIDIGVNLNAVSDVLPPFDVADTDTYNFTTATTVYDSLGSGNTLSLYFRKDAPNTWTAFSYIDGSEVNQAGGDEILFDSEGSIESVNGSQSSSLTIPPFQPSTGGDTLNLTLEVGKISQYNSAFGVNQIVQDGFGNGRLDNISIDDDGKIQGRYSNGQSQQMGQIILTNFANPEGLHNANGTSWKESYASGSALVGEPGSSSLGRIRAGALEDSNVDVTSELVSMIGAQRSFQANAQVITTIDTITQTVINMRR